MNVYVFRSGIVKSDLPKWCVSFSILAPCGLEARVD